VIIAESLRLAQIQNINDSDNFDLDDIGEEFAAGTPCLNTPFEMNQNPNSIPSLYAPRLLLVQKR
jgi:hypothetical protein